VCTSMCLRCAVYSRAGTTSVVLTLRGLEIMNDDPAQVDVLYVKVLPDEGLTKLKRVCSECISHCL
jgi:hypothetical protein